jgi:alpha-glucosidase
MAAPAEQDLLWWQRGVIYQVYPRSFADSNGDGIGDLAGVISKLDYLQWLGVDAIWLSPIFPSPMADFGYDVSDYVGIDPVFGTMDDFDRLLEEAHARGLRVILDFVPNHTSDQHPWFIDSRTSRQHPKRDWYIWRDGREDGTPPNNWMSHFGGSAWEWDEATAQYYYHAFLPQQPDLNWRNPQVQAAMTDVLRFWLSRGVDGFRVDVIWLLIKDLEFRDNPLNPAFSPMLAPHDQYLHVYSSDRPEIHDVIAILRAALEEYGDRVMIGELYLPVDRLVAYYGRGGEGVHLPFNFQLLQLPWKAAGLNQAIREYESALPAFGWPNWVLSNHDRSRIATRIGAQQARVAAMMLLTLRGTPTLYYGDELGMSDVPIPPERVQDPFEKRVPGQGFGRDPHRTPMQWDRLPNAGFTTGEPWLPVGPDFTTENVAAQREDPHSMLTLHRRLLALRRSRALTGGQYGWLPPAGDVIAYARSHGEERFVIVLNLGDATSSYAVPATKGAVIELSTYLDREGPSGEVVDVRAHEGLVIRTAPDRP